MSKVSSALFLEKFIRIHSNLYNDFRPSKYPMYYLEKKIPRVILSWAGCVSNVNKEKKRNFCVSVVRIMVRQENYAALQSSQETFLPNSAGMSRLYVRTLLACSCVRHFHIHRLSSLFSENVYALLSWAKISREFVEKWSQNQWKKLWTVSISNVFYISTVPT